MIGKRLLFDDNQIAAFDLHSTTNYVMGWPTNKNFGERIKHH